MLRGGYEPNVVERLLSKKLPVVVVNARLYKKLKEGIRAIIQLTHRRRPDIVLPMERLVMSRRTGEVRDEPRRKENGTGADVRLA